MMLLKFLKIQTQIHIRVASIEKNSNRYPLHNIFSEKNRYKASKNVA